METPHHIEHDHLRGVHDADFLALGLGGTSMMSMLWTVAMGRRAVGVEMRGDPFLGVHWNIREDLYHQLGLLDQMMLARYGEDRLPRRGDGRIFRLAECFYSLDTVAGDIVADEIIDGYDRHQHIVGTIHHVEFIDDRWRDGIPNRLVTLLQPPPPPPVPDPARIRDDIVEVLDGPSTFQAGAASVLVLLRRYLERMEQQDLESGCEVPRVRLFTRHRVVPAEGDGFLRRPDGRIGIRIEALQELDFKGRFVRLRAPGTEVIDLGVPELFMVAEGFSSSDTQRLGFEQRDVEVDHGDGRGPVVAQADYLAGLIEALVGGRLRRRISSAFDDDGKEYWVRQIAVGHEDDPEVGWVLVQVPDFKTFDPVQAGLVPPDTDPESPEFYAAYQHLLYGYYIEQAADILELPQHELMKVQMVYGPKIFSLVERVGTDAQLAANGVVAGDSFGNGHFLTSGGAMTGMVGHSARVLAYWQARDAGTPPPEAIRTLAEAIRQDTEAWLHVSAQEYSEAVPINFGAERIKQINAAGGIDPDRRSAAVDAARRKRHSLLPLDPSDWRRLFLRNGKVRSAPLPELHAMHPALRAQRSDRPRAKPSVAYVARALLPDETPFIQALLRQPGVRLGLISQGPLDGLTPRLRDRLAGHVAVADCADPQQVAEALEALAPQLGQPGILLGIDDEVQVALGEVREARGIAGRAADGARLLADQAAMVDRLHHEGLPVARAGLARSVEDAVRFARQVGYPLLVSPPPPRGSAPIRVAGDDELRAVLGPLEEDPRLAVLCEEDVARWPSNTLEVMTVDGVPAWCSATRAEEGRPESPGMARSITLPREVDDPADPGVRRMGFAALRALGIGSGLSSLRWFRRADGSTAIAEVVAHPPSATALSLLGHAHGADFYGVWANVALHGLFAPIPRVAAAGALLLRAEGQGGQVVAVQGWDEASRRLGGVVVEVRLPEVGRPRAEEADGDGVVVVCHPDTAVVDEALATLASTVGIELG